MNIATIQNNRTLDAFGIKDNSPFGLEIQALPFGQRNNANN